MIAHTKIKDGMISLPIELIQKYKIDESTMLVIVPIDGGIFIKPMTKDISDIQRHVEQGQSVETEVDAIITVLTNSLGDTQAIESESQPKK